MSDELVPVAAFATPVEASIVINLLRRNGIQATLANEAVTSWLWHYSAAVGGAKVLVRKQDEALAREIIENPQQSQPSEQSMGAYPTESWICPKCDEELSPEFESCWKCGTRYRAEEHETDPEEDYNTLYGDPTDWSPEEHEEEDEPLEVPSSETLVLRAWRASVIGLLLVPPVLQIYSMWLILKVAFRNETLSLAGRRRFYGALIINILVGALASILGMTVFNAVAWPL